MNRSKRVLIAQATLKILQTGHYQSPDGTKIDIQAQQQRAVESSKWYQPSAIESLDVESKAFDTQIEVFNQTTQQAASSLIEQGENRLFALNFASAKNPGGGFLNGSQAQEESLARSSGLYPTLLQHKGFYELHRERKHAMYTDNMIYSPDVPFLRDDVGNLLEVPYLMSILTSPAVNAGAVKRNLPEEVANIPTAMITRTEKVLRIAAHHEHEVLILGAWGCGVFRNNPAEIAAYFAHHLLNEGSYARQFRRIVFAVLDRTKDQANIDAFSSQFGISG